MPGGWARGQLLVHALNFLPRLKVKEDPSQSPDETAGPVTDQEALARPAQRCPGWCAASLRHLPSLGEPSPLKAHRYFLLQGANNPSVYLVSHKCVPTTGNSLHKEIRAWYIRTRNTLTVPTSFRFLASVPCSKPTIRLRPVKCEWPTPY